MRSSFVPLTILLAVNVTAAAPVPTFYRDIAPIIYQNCSTCHRPGESGPFSLLNYEDVRRHALQIAAVTKTHFMPPWLPEAGHGGAFTDERRLSAEQIELIQAWVKHGSLAGTAADGPASPQFTSEWRLGTPDMVLHVAQPYKLGPDGAEVFWNFVIPVPVKTVRWVKAMEVRAGESEGLSSCECDFGQGGVVGAEGGDAGYWVSGHGSHSRRRDVRSGWAFFVVETGESASN